MLISRPKIKLLSGKVARIAIIIVIHYAPAGIIGLMLKYTSRKPLRWFMLIVIQLFKRPGIAKLVRKLLWEKYEKIAK
ncbi:hypothetical protein CBG25_07320 [Arsenophonus sp. ENCA]|nr:hypothetical protein CBG25_07320 [Arsenophonus sp. ENCA]